MSALESREYMFVSGCARSGTTVAATILNWSDSVFVAQEHYGPLIRRQPELFHPGLYTSPGLHGYVNGQNNYRDFASQGEYSAFYARPKRFDALDDYRFIGDKLIDLYRHFDVFMTPPWSGEKVVLIHLVRNIEDVAASYQTRNLDQTDNWDLDYLSAIPEWEDSIRLAHAFHSRVPANVRMGLVDYDSFFKGGLADLASATRRLYDFVGLELDQAELQGLQHVHRAGAFFRARRQTYEKISADIRSRVDVEVMRQYRDLVSRSL